MNLRLYQSCSMAIDYSAVPAERIIAFTFALDEAQSVLYPGEGQLQSFCYTITGVGEDNSGYVDLSHFVLGVCAGITMDDIVSARVTIDGVEQTVTLGENVEVFTEESPDPTTGCPGLKFDFALSKAGGVMRACFTLARPFPVGPTPVCVKGGQVVLNNLSVCGPACGAYASCETVVSQRATLCVPITVTPFATTGNISTYCCGTPIITAGTAACAGEVNTSCSFTITQDVCLGIPVAFGASAEPGPSYTTCLTPVSGGICEGCADNG